MALCVDGLPAARRSKEGEATAGDPRDGRGVVLCNEGDDSARRRKGGGLGGGPN